MERKNAIRVWLLSELEAIQYDGRFTGPQCASVDWFLPSRLTKVYDSSPIPLPSDSEVVEVLNEFLAEGKIKVSALAMNGKDITVFLMVP